MTESKCQSQADCKDVKLVACPGPLACLYGSCVCTWNHQSKSSTCQVICAHSRKRLASLADFSICDCGDK